MDPFLCDLCCSLHSSHPVSLIDQAPPGLWPKMALAAKAFGATGYFFEVHPTPDEGLSDAANMLELDKLEALVEKLTK